MNGQRTGYGSALRIRASALLAGAGLTLLLVGGLGCGEEPGPEDLLTTVELAAGPAVGDSLPASARARVTFRDWFTGGVVIEARVSSTLDAGDLAPLLAGDAEDHALAWDQVMGASTSTGLAEQPLVGYRGLIRDIDLELPAGLAGGDSLATFLVAYLADVEEIEREDLPDSLVITPRGRDAGILNDVLVVGTEAGP
jgi:hypothetical protein